VGKSIQRENMRTNSAISFCTGIAQEQGPTFRKPTGLGNPTNRRVIGGGAETRLKKRGGERSVSRQQKRKEKQQGGKGRTIERII